MLPDEIALKTLRLLTDACKRGVSVVLIMDSFGSSDMKDYHYHDLRSNGGIVLEYNPYTVAYFFSHLFDGFWKPKIFAYRDHKKCIIIDDKIAFTGGMNISGEYCSHQIEGGWDKFRDTHCRLSGGDVIQSLKEAFYYSLLDINPRIEEESTLEQILETLGIVKPPEADTRARFFPLQLLPSFMVKRKWKRSKSSNGKDRYYDDVNDKTRQDMEKMEDVPLNSSYLWRRSGSSGKQMNRWDSFRERYSQYKSRSLFGNQYRKSLMEWIHQSNNPSSIDTAMDEGMGREEVLVVGDQVDPERQMVLSRKFSSAEVEVESEEDEGMREEKENNSGTYVQVLESYRNHQLRNIQKALVGAIQRSMSHIVVMTPYFLPPYELRRAILAAAERLLFVPFLSFSFVYFCSGFSGFCL